MYKKIGPVLLVFAVYGSPAQQTLTDSATSSQNNARDFAQNLYLQSREGQAALYNGILHYNYLSTIEGTAYFYSPEWQKGDVIYAGMFYKNVLLKYDQVKDQLIVTGNFPGAMPIAVYSPRVSRFSFSGYTFVWINRQTDVSLPEGFYRQLVTGKVTVMSRTNKIISERIVDNMIARKFEEKTLYYIFRDGKYFQIGNQKHLVQVLKDRKKEVKRFIKDKKMIYHDNPEEMIVSVVSFYNQL